MKYIASIKMASLLFSFFVSVSTSCSLNTIFNLIKKQDNQSVKSLLKSESEYQPLGIGLQLCKDKSEKKSPLHHAAKMGNLALVQLFLKTASKLLNHKDTFGRTALVEAIEQLHLEVVEFLLEQPDINIGACTAQGNTPLACALRSNPAYYSPQVFQRVASPGCIKQFCQISRLDQSNQNISKHVYLISVLQKIARHKKIVALLKKKGATTEIMPMDLSKPSMWPNDIIARGGVKEDSPRQVFQRRLNPISMNKINCRRSPRESFSLPDSSDEKTAISDPGTSVSVLPAVSSRLSSSSSLQQTVGLRPFDPNDVDWADDNVPRGGGINPYRERMKARAAARTDDDEKKQPEQDGSLFSSKFTYDGSGLKEKGATTEIMPMDLLKPSMWPNDIIARGGVKEDSPRQVFQRRLNPLCIDKINCRQSPRESFSLPDSSDEKTAISDPGTSVSVLPAVSSRLSSSSSLQQTVGLRPFDPNDVDWADDNVPRGGGINPYRERMKARAAARTDDDEKKQPEQDGSLFSSKFTYDGSGRDYQRRAQVRPIDTSQFGILGKLLFEGNYVEALRIVQLGETAVKASHLKFINTPHHETGKLSLIEEVKKGSLENVKALVKLGADINAIDREGRTAKQIVQVSGNLEILDFLTLSGLEDPTGERYWQTDFYKALVEERYDDAVVMKMGNDFIWSEHYKVMLNSPDKFGDTPLMRAIRAKDTHKLNYLLHLGADPLTFSEKGISTVQLAAQNDMELVYKNAVKAVGKQRKEEMDQQRFLEEKEEKGNLPS